MSTSELTSDEHVDKELTTPPHTPGTDELDIQRMLEIWLPDQASRQQVLTHFADMVEIAAAANPQSWAITVRSQVRMVVGIYAVADIVRGAISMTLSRAALAPEHLPRLQQLPNWDTFQFKSAPDALVCVIAADELAGTLPLIREAHAAFIRWAASTSRRAHPGSLAAHQPAVVAYLRQALSRAIPDPTYDKPGGGAQALAHIDRATVEAAFAIFDTERRTTAAWQTWEKDPTFRYALNWDGRRYPVKEIVRIASGSVDFSSRQARGLLQRLGFQITTLASGQQRYWLFQANPRYYDLAEHLATARAGDEDTWAVTRYRDDMRSGDKLLLWLAGPNAGIHAIGELAGEPREYTYGANSDDRPTWVEGDPDTPVTVWRVLYRYTHIFSEPIRKATLQEHPILKKMLVLRAPTGTNFPITLDEWEALHEIIERVPEQEQEPLAAERYTLEQCAEETGLDQADLERWLRAIERKGQAVLYGPPGTGKTYVAQRIARHLVTGGDGFTDLVQFHPAYTYEDFMQGIRPQSQVDGTLSYPMVPGRFLDFCARARAVADTCVLIIDELNRANLARVFGELMYLLEYRDQHLPLAGGGLLSIPPNVRIIGTMNTADRSIALVDHALRRRFAFLPLQPNYTILQRFHERHGSDARGLAVVLEQINQAIGDPHYAVGISFFMRPRLSTDLEDIWRMEIEPYLEEYFFDRRETFERFRWARVSQQVLL